VFGLCRGGLLWGDPPLAAGPSGAEGEDDDRGAQHGSGEHDRSGRPPSRVGSGVDEGDAGEAVEAVEEQRGSGGVEEEDGEGEPVEAVDDAGRARAGEPAVGGGAEEGHESYVDDEQGDDGDGRRGHVGEGAAGDADHGAGVAESGDEPGQHRQTCGDAGERGSARHGAPLFVGESDLVGEAPDEDEVDPADAFDAEAEADDVDDDRASREDRECEDADAAVDPQRGGQKRDEHGVDAEEPQWTQDQFDGAGDGLGVVDEGQSDAGDCPDPGQHRGGD